MSKVPVKSAGTFVRWELMTTTAPAAKQFYQRLFAWQMDDEELADGVIYTHLRHGQKRFGGLYPMSVELAARPAAAHWLPYVGVADVDTALAAAKEKGAKVTAESFGFADLGHMALIQDPTGAPIGLWQDAHASVSSPASLAWHELSTHNAEVATQFYQQMFDWQAESEGQGPINIKMFTVGARPVAAMITLSTRFQAVPAHWLPYFQVEDMELTVAAIKAGGGRLLAAPVSHIWGAQAVAQDPQGAVFGVMTSTAH